MTCANCIDLEERVRQLAASNRALVAEYNKLRGQMLEQGLKEIVEAPAMDLTLKAELTGGIK